MTKNYSMNITPDSLSGIIFAFEGIKNAVVLLNGPSGCKFYHSAISDNQSFRQLEFDPLNFPENWFFGQPRVPCTYLDKRDYVYGSKNKLSDALKFLAQNMECQLVVIINSPGAALIGDDLKGIAKETLSQERPLDILTIESPMYSKCVWDGYTLASKKYLEEFAYKMKKTDVSGKSVNILGLSIYQKYFKGDKEELERLLALSGISVNCIPFCETSLSDMENLCNADLNVVLDPAYGLEMAEILKSKFDMPYYYNESPPIGFANTEKFFTDICEILGVSVEPILEDGKKARAVAYANISRVNSITGLPKGCTFAISATAATALGYTEFLVKYYGMLPDAIMVLDDDISDGKSLSYIALENFLAQRNLEHTLEVAIEDTNANMVFTDANMLSKLKLRNHEHCGIEISLPSFGYLDVVPKTHLGIKGALWLTEVVLNGLPF